MYEYFSECDKQSLDRFLTQLDHLVPDDVRYRIPAWSDLRRLVCPVVGESDREAGEQASDGTPQDCMVECILFCEQAQKKLEQKRQSLQRFVEEHLLKYGPMAEERTILFNECDKEIKKWKKVRDQLYHLFSGQDCPREDDVDQIGRIIDRNLTAYKTRCSRVQKKNDGFSLPFASRGPPV